MPVIKRISQFCSEFIMVAITQVLTAFIDIILTLNRKTKNIPPAEKHIAIEAGTRGWDSIYFQELKASAVHFFGEENVLQVEINDPKHRIIQLKRALDGKQVTHLLYDPRTNFTSSFRSLLEAIQINIYCYKQNISVLVSLTDPSLSVWRLQSALASRRTGKIFSPMDTSKLGWLRWRLPISGPHFMPISPKTFLSLEPSIISASITVDSFHKLEFRGTLYPTRLEFFERLNTELSGRNSKIILKAREKSEIELTSDQYWKELVDSKICVTTTFQYVYGKFRVDRSGINQMVFRISEALAAGNLLFTSDYPGIEKYFIPGHDLIVYSDANDLSEKLIEFSQNLSEANRIRLNGMNKMKSLLLTGYFWHELLER